MASQSNVLFSAEAIAIPLMNGRIDKKMNRKKCNVNKFYFPIIFLPFNCEIMREMDGFAMIKYAIVCRYS